MFNDIMHLDLCRLMVYMLNYALPPDEAKPVSESCYISCYNFYVSTFYSLMLTEDLAMGL